MPCTAPVAKGTEAMLTWRLARRRAETIDYGPYGFLERFDPNFTPNTSDLDGMPVLHL